MVLFGPTWKKFGERRNRECVPKFRFEGKGVFYKDMKNKVWHAQNKSKAYFQLHGQMQELDIWGEVNGVFGHTKCLSNMFITVVQARMTQNSMGKALEFGLYRDEVRIKKFITFDVNTNGAYFSTPPVGISFTPIPVVFDSDYAFGFQTVDGSFPTHNDSNVTLSFSVSTLVQMGAGDP